MSVRKILLVDDHPIVREGFARLLNEDGGNKVVATASGGKEAIVYAKHNTLDVAVVDINMDDINGIQVISKLKAIQPDIKVIILSVNEVEPFVTKSFEAGANAFLSKRCAPEELTDAIKSVCKGEQYLSEHVYRQIALDKLNNKENELETLTDREFEVFQCLAKGNSMNDIAIKLNISPKTGYVYRGNIFKKLNLSTLAELVQYAHRHNIV